MIRQPTGITIFPKLNEYHPILRSGTVQPKCKLPENSQRAQPSLPVYLRASFSNVAVRSSMTWEACEGCKSMHTRCTPGRLTTSAPKIGKLYLTDGAETACDRKRKSTGRRAFVDWKIVRLRHPMIFRHLIETGRSDERLHRALQAFRRQLRSK